MTETLLLPESVVLTPEATDESLIDAARWLNVSYNGHMKRLMEDFWRISEALYQLFQRRHLHVRWADVLKQVGINVTTDNHARRLSQATTLDGLSKFKNKTQALRFFGILSTPPTSAKTPDVASPGASNEESEEYTGSPGGEQISVGLEEGGRDRATTAERPESRVVPSNTRQAVENANVPVEIDDDETPPIASQPTAQKTVDSLECLAMVAAQMEYLAADLKQVTPDHLAQIDRLLVAIDLIRSKGVVDAA